MKYLLGIDFGGGASKATLLSEKGEICATNTTEYATNYPKPGYAEQNPDDWVKATCENIRGVLEKNGERKILNYEGFLCCEHSLGQRMV